MPDILVVGVIPTRRLGWISLLAPESSSSSLGGSDVGQRPRPPRLASVACLRAAAFLSRASTASRRMGKAGCARTLMGPRGRGLEALPLQVCFGTQG